VKFLAAADVEALMKACGVSADKDSLKRLIDSMQGKQMHELIREGTEKLASVSAGKLPIDPFLFQL